MTAKDRLKQFAGAMNMSMRRLCLTAGLDEGYSKTFSGNPRADVIKKLETTYPQLNIQWLCNGIGEMFKEGESENIRIINSQIKGNYSGNNAGGDIKFADSQGSALEKITALEKENARLQAQVETLQALTDKLLGMLNK